MYNAENALIVKIINLPGKPLNLN